MGNSSSKSNKAPRTSSSRLSAKLQTSDFDREAATRKYQQAIWSSPATGSDEPPPYYSPEQRASLYSPAEARPAEPSPGSRHTRVYDMPNPRVPTSSSYNRYKDPVYLTQPLRKESKENALDTLRKYDTVLIVDDSKSMEGARWAEAKAALAGLATIASEYDTDGLDIHFLNHYSASALGVKVMDGEAVKELFDHVQPYGLTPIGEKLEGLLSEYIRRLENAQNLCDKGDSLALKQIKPVNFIVITDGAPTDDPESVIVAAARRLDASHFPLSQVGIQFVQIGNSRKAAAYLNELDDALSNRHMIRDIVDTTPFLNARLTSDVLIKILLGGINRRVDRRGAEAVIDF